MMTRTMSTLAGDFSSEYSEYPSIITASTSSRDSIASTSREGTSSVRGVKTCQFRGFENMRNLLNTQFCKLQGGLSNDEYLGFRPVTEADLSKIDRLRDTIGKNIRTSYDRDDCLLIVKFLPTLAHETAHLLLGMELFHAFREMRVQGVDLWPCGAMRYRGRSHSKEGDSSFKPVPPRGRESD